MCILLGLDTMMKCYHVVIVVVDVHTNTGWCCMEEVFPYCSVMSLMTINAKLGL